MLQWIDALEFQDYGGFYDETQFAHEMGQGYLMALNIPGVPVAPAHTEFEVQNAGMYRVWVRTKNWYKAASPGKLRVTVDGCFTEKEVGALPTDHWYWEVSCDMHLEPGTHTLTVTDTTGYFGRFAAVIITDDMDYTPEFQVERMLRERALIRGENPEPAEQGSWDVVVAGGGPAGIPAALAVARKGMKVVLLQSRPGLGGNASDEADVGLDGASNIHPFMRETGIAEEVRRLHDMLGISWEGAFRMLVEKEPNLTIYYNQFVMDAETVDGVIRNVTTMDTRNCRRYRYQGKMFIDCTGDGWLGYWAGARYRLGRESRWQYQEATAPITADSFTMSGCLMGTMDGKQVLGYHAVDTGAPVPFCAPHWAVQLPADLYRQPTNFNQGPWWLENPTDLDDLWEQEAIRDELIRLGLGYFHWLKNDFEKRDLLQNYKIDGFPHYNARRENRRIIGDYVLSHADLDGKHHFEDAISYCGWPLDVHHPRGIYSGKDGPFDHNFYVPLSEIPYRCIYSKNISNLLMAGRCVSVSHAALGSVRVESTLATLGQAAGTAAWLAIINNTTPRGVYEHHMKQLQQILLRDDLYIPGVRNEDPRDLARKARVTATSFSTVERFNPRRGFPGDWAPMDRGRIAVIDSKAPVEYVKALLKNGQNVPLTVHAELVQLGDFGDFDNVVLQESVEVEIPAGFTGYYTLPFRMAVANDGRNALRIRSCPGLFWQEICFENYGGEQINDHRWTFSEMKTYEIETRDQNLALADCRPESVINGCSRIVSPEEYCWVSDPEQKLPQSLTLELEKPADLDSVQLVFETDLNSPKKSFMRRQYVAQTVQDYTLSVRQNGTWKDVAAVRGNFLRRAIHSVQEQTVEAVRLTVEKTWGSPCAVVTEVRIYGK